MTYTFQCSYCGQDYQCRRVVDDSGPWRPYSQRLADPHYRPARLTCSKPCATRRNVWQSWITKSRAQAVGGDVNKPAKVSDLGTGGLADAVAPFAVDPDQLTFAA